RTANRLVGAIAPEATARFARKLLMKPQAHRPRDWELGALERAERITFRFGLSGLRWGNSGPVVLAMHGWSGRATQFAAFIEPLLASGRQVVALEAPAHGQSPGDEAHVFAFTESILEIAAELKGLEAVIGHSMGGAAALHAVQLGLPAERVVTIGAPAALPRVLARFSRWLSLPEAAERRFIAAVDRHVGIKSEELDFSRHAPQPGVSGLIVHDRDDREVPYSEAEALSAAWPQARLLATTGLGHGRVLADPDVVRTVTAFLAAAPQARAA
ncbi:MAG: alpha/beta fold hydrolase, partial [Xanthomonadales bacterium]|nr:alpha/beta fold hydrolase [Xanthomonadales bacterium]